METKTIKKIKKELLNDIKRLKDKKGFIRAGLPGYDRFFGRDSLILSWQLLDIKPEIARKTLEILIQLQGKKVNKFKEEEPGKILHEHSLTPLSKKTLPYPLPYYGSIDSTPLFLIIFSFYCKKSKDKNFIKKYWPNVLMAVHWIFHFGDQDGDLFLEYKRKRKTGLFHQGWKDNFENHLKIQPPVAIVEAQGYEYLALVEIAGLAKKFFNDTALKNSLLARAKKLKSEFNKKFWMKNEKYYALALDENKKQKKTITSNPGHLLFTGICHKDKEKLVIEKLFSNELWTPYGIRTHSIKEKDFNPLSYHLGSVWPHDNWIIAQGLKKLGYKKQYLKIKNALISAYNKLGHIPELYGVVKNKLVKIPIACHPQAWASGALLSFVF